MFIATIPLIVLFAGVLIYILAANQKLVWIGQVMICVGMGAALLGANAMVSAFTK